MSIAEMNDNPADDSVCQCLTLPSAIALQAQVGTQENKEFVAAALKHIGVPSTGTVDSDILKFSNHVKQ